MPRKCTICKIIKDESKFNEPKINKDKEVGLTKSCKKCNLEINGNKKKSWHIRICWSEKMVAKL